MDLGRYIEEKWVRNAKIRHFLGKTHEWYRYQKVVPVPIGSKGLVPVPVKVVPIPLLPATIFLHIYAPISSIFVHKLLGTLRNDYWGFK